MGAADAPRCDSRDPDELETRVLVLAPTGRNAPVVCETLTEAGLVARICPDMDALCAGLRQGAGCAVVAEEALRDTGRRSLTEVLSAQPVWSDVPLVVLLANERDPAGPARRLSAEGATNVTLLPRPLHKVILLSTVRTALRARRRQLQVRDDLVRHREAERALRESQRNLERTQALSLVMPLHVSLDGRWLRLPPTFVTFLGYDREEELLGRPFREVTHPDDFPADWRQVERLLRGEIRSYEMEKRFLRRDGSVTWGYLNCSLVADDEGRPLHLLTYVRDVNAQKEAEEALRRARDELEQRVAERTAELEQRARQLARLSSELTLAEQRERQRLATLLHDHLQQLLVAARVNMDLMGRDTSPEVEGTVETVRSLLEESIQASRALTAELSPPILHAAGLPAGLEWLGRWMDEKHGLSVAVALGPDTRPPREDVKVLLFQSVRELLFNVVKHAGVREARVELAPHLDGELRVTVRDRGRGFAADDPSTGSAVPRNGDLAGGFGLFSIRERLQLLGGRMRIRSAPGQGTEVVLVAPCEPPLAAPPPPALAPRPTPTRASRTAVGAPPAGGRQTARGRTRVLLVDDHAVVREGIARLVDAEADLEIVGQAAGGEEAIELARRLLPDVILMDSSMPGMDGVAATRAIHAELPHVRIIGLSMFEEADRASAMCAAGAVRYLTKSGSSDVLLATIRSVGAPQPE